MLLGLTLEGKLRKGNKIFFFSVVLRTTFNQWVEPK
jgi:hypothetical protein